jgi:Chlorophyll A-B binding protein
MLAVAGLIAQELVHLPDAAFSNPLATEAFFQVPVGGLAQIFLFCGLCELIGHKGKITYGDMLTAENADRIPGDLGFNPLNVKIDERMRLREIKVCTKLSFCFRLCSSGQYDG